METMNFVGGKNFTINSFPRAIHPDINLWKHIPPEAYAKGVTINIHNYYGEVGRRSDETPSETTNEGTNPPDSELDRKVSKENNRTSVKRLRRNQQKEDPERKRETRSDRKWKRKPKTRGQKEEESRPKR